jgi:hypothetical protein
MRWLSFILTAGLMGSSGFGATVTVSVSADAEQGVVSDMLVGTGLVYAWENDALYADGSIADMIRDVGLEALRWPGGAVVTYYHWNDLNGNGWSDSWNPAYSRSSDQPPENYMRLDEYLNLIDRSGAEIMLGVNMSSGKEWNREAEGIEEAKALAQYCSDRGYDVRYVYFDNESYHDGNNYNRDVDGDGESWTPESYAESLNLYAAAVREVFPDAKRIANWKNSVTTGTFQTQISNMLAIAGANIDYLDVHWYWQWDTASWDVWKSQRPMLQTSGSTTAGYSYRDAVVYANDLFSRLGFPNVRLAVMEWNIAPGPWEEDPEHTNFKTALMQAEMELQFMQAGLDIGMLWTLQSPSVDSTSERHVMAADGSANATALWQWLFAKSGDMARVDSSSTASGVYSAAARGSDGRLLVYLLNKTDADVTVEFSLSGYSASEVSEAWRFRDDGTGRGILQKIGLWQTAGQWRTALSSNSVNFIGFNYPAMEDSDLDGMDDAWEIKNFGSLNLASADSDQDSDGFSDCSEFVAGTDPSDSSSRLVLDLNMGDDGSSQLSWKSRIGLRYRLQSTDSLLAGTWSDGPLCIGMPGVTALSTDGQGAASQFLRLQLQSQ